MSLLSRPFNGEPEKRTISESSANIPMWSELSEHGPMTGSRAMKISTVNACVRILMDSVAQLPINSYRRKDGVRLHVEPAPTFIQSPYPGITWTSWLKMMMRSAALTGNAFGYITGRSPNGAAAAILPLHPDAVQISSTEGDWVSPVYIVNGKKIPKNDMLHIKRFPEPGCPIGKSPIEEANAALHLANVAERFGARFFEDVAVPSGILSTDQDITPLQATETARRWKESHGGRRRPAVLGNGMDFTPITMSPTDSQFIETRTFQKSEIAMIFGIPPHKIGDLSKQTSYGQGIEQISIDFVVSTLASWLVCFEQEIDLILPRGQFSKFNIDALLRGDQKSRYESFQIALQNGWLSANEVRTYMDLAPIENGDDYMFPSNFLPRGYIHGNSLPKGIPAE